jgi:16S rRNA (adenine1518-N6/adenine1519-N6)-dimethyltransferase
MSIIDSMKLEKHFTKKKFGQHFLVDKNIAKKIAGSLSLSGSSYNKLLEIGSGNGALTEYLSLLPGIKLYTIEIDTELIPVILEKFPQLEKQIINEDILLFDLERTFKEQVGIIGNFPYNISSQILFKVIENRNKVPEVVGMFQKEVAERITSPPGNKVYGILSVLVQAFYHAEYLFTVSRNVFYPRPNVESAVIRLIRKESFFLNCDEPRFFQVVKQAFNKRRKTLKNALHLYSFLPECDPLLMKRAEQLSFEDYIFLTKSIKP